MPLPSVRVPSGVPNFVDASQEVDESDIYARVKPAQGATRSIPIFTATEQTRKVASKALNQAQMAALNDWWENALLVGARNFSVELTNEGPGTVWWEAKWAAPWKAEARNGRWFITGDLVLFGEPGDTPPVADELSVEFVVSLQASALILTQTNLAVEIVVALESASALHVEFLVSLLATNTPLALEIVVPLTAAATLGGPVGTVEAEDVSIDDAGGYFGGTDVEAALQQVGAALRAGAPSPVSPPETGGNRDIANGDAGRYIRFNDSSPQTATFQEDATEPLADDFEVHIRCVDADVTLTPDGAVVLNPPSGGSLVLSAGMTVTVKRVDVDEFDVMGQTVPA